MKLTKSCCVILLKNSAWILRCVLETLKMSVSSGCAGTTPAMHVSHPSTTRLWCFLSCDSQSLACWLQHAHLKLTLLLSPMMMSPQLEMLSKHHFASPTSLGEPWRPTRHQTVLRHCTFICSSRMCQPCPGGVTGDQKTLPYMTSMTSSTPPLYGEHVFLTLLFVPLLFSSFLRDSVAVRTKAVEP